MRARTPYRFERGEFPASTFLLNLKEARENGYELVCAECGVGINDDSDWHDSGCPEYPEEGYDLR
jgi:hypothetical protein